MKKIYISMGVALLASGMFAQNQQTKTADKLFNRFEYVAAAKNYLKLVDQEKADAYVYKQLAESYYNVFDAPEAVNWYAKAVTEKQPAEVYYHYAQMLKATGKYELANKQMQEFAKLAPNDQRAKAFLADPNYLPKLASQQKSFDVQKLDFNSEAADFAAVLTQNDQVYFVSASNKSRRTDGWNKEAFLDIYRTQRNADGSYTKPEPVTELNTKWHDGPVSISADGTTMYFAKDSHDENSFEKDKSLNAKFGQVNLYKANNENGKWSNISAVPFNSTAYSNSSSSLSKDGKTLYFTSNMPGSKGDSDIWKVAIKPDGSYGTPENMGPNVNTEGKEQFPFVSDDNILYFASNGRQGFGGLDVFQIDLNNPGPAVNLGKPVNTEKDDFALTFHVQKNTGFLSSNRSGNDDIYGITPVCALDVTTIVSNTKTGDVLANAKVAILDDRKNIIATQTTNEKGEVSYKVECEKAYVIQASKEGFESNTFAVAKVSKASKARIDAALNPIEHIITPTEVVLNPIFFEYNKSNITQEGAFELDKLVEAMKSNDKLVVFVKSHTDNRGGDVFNMNLSDRRAKATVQYVLSKGIAESRISGKGFGESEPKVDCKDTCTEEDHAQNRRSEFLIVK
ncbi:OmpA family protein [Flavobacterium branchiophilum]|uniref:Cell envelope biogenesis protein OmpA n=2 Tax=Flavobacterium branchiophilum TaxID=55197 RepID=A0A2H3KB90_9FLAO|nr:OmpA family protein [Flavobacterium branchiophilum]PDS22868.1 cell envelope biogenesis protein OmpA [Flavobacterium branchiophilum]CCB68564.1 Probable outer membrane protein precursor, OmpA family [Flavobacterium branchiophilum FL-15]